MHTMTTISDAISYSTTHDTRPECRVRDHRTAESEARAIAEAAGLEYDSSDEDDGSIDAYAWRTDAADEDHAWRIRIVDDEIAAKRLMAACADLHDGSDTLGIVCRQAVEDDPSATEADVRRIWAEATEEASA